MSPTAKCAKRTQTPTIPRMAGAGAWRKKNTRMSTRMVDEGDWSKTGRRRRGGEEHENEYENDRAGVCETNPGAEFSENGKRGGLEEGEYEDEYENDRAGVCETNPGAEFSENGELVKPSAASTRPT